MKNKKAFTLAEIMVALTTLGVLAALLIPAITSTQPDKNIVMFRKAYYTLEKAMNEMISDEIHYPGNRDCNISGVAVDCGFSNTALTADIPAGNSKFCYLLTQQLNVINTVSGCNAATPEFITSDGTRWRLYNLASIAVDGQTPATSNGAVRIVFDVDNKTTSNCGNATTNVTTTCAAGKTSDLYEVAVKYDGTMGVVSPDGVTYLSNPTMMKYLSNPTKMKK